MTDQERIERLAKALWVYEGTPGEAWENVDRGPLRDPLRAKATVLLAAMEANERPE